MICIMSQHFYLNRILLLAVGLWPYQQSKFAQLQVSVIFGILASFIIFQFMAFFTVKCTPDLVIKILASAIFFLIYLIEHNSFWINMQAVKYLLEQLQHICNQLKDENEIAIIRDCKSFTKLFTTGMMIITICNIMTFASLPFLNNICGFVLHINVSRSHHAMQIMTEHFVDQEEFYLILLSVSWCIGLITVTAIGTTFVGCIIYFCGMFKIASYRIERAMARNVLQDITRKDEIRIYKEIILAVDIHRKAMKCSTFLTTNFEGMFFLLALISVFCLSLNFFRIISFGGNLEDFLLHLHYICVLFVHMFVCNYAGQEITDHNNRIFFTAYNIQWYTAPLHIQKLILLLLQRGNKPFYLSVGGLIITSLETFASLISASISYFAVMHSMQH